MSKVTATARQKAIEFWREVFRFRVKTGPHNIFDSVFKRFIEAKENVGPVLDDFKHAWSMGCTNH